MNLSAAVPELSTVH